MRRAIVATAEEGKWGGREHMENGVRVAYWTARPHRNGWRSCGWRKLLPEVFRDERFKFPHSVRRS